MFNPIAKILMVLTACLIGWGVYQSNRIDELTAENTQQAELISQQQTVNQQLTVQIEQERQAVVSQQKLATALRTQMETKREQVKTILVKEPCSATPLPRGVIEQLHK